MSSRIIHTADIIEEILDYVQAQSHSSAGTSDLELRPLLNFGLASRIFLDGVLDRIWRKASLIHLARIMPSQFWHLDPEERPTNREIWCKQTMEMKSSSATDSFTTDRFLSYGRRIRELEWIDDTCKTDEYPLLGDSICAAWTTYLKAYPHSICPNIRQVTFNQRGLVYGSKIKMDFFSAMIPPQLDRLVWFMPKEDGRRSFVRLLRHMSSPTRPLQISSIAVHWEDGDLSDAIRDPCLQHMRNLFTKGTLRNLHTDYPLLEFSSPSQLSHFHQLVSLRMSVTTLVENWHTSPPKVFLPSLLTLTLIGAASHILFFISHISSEKLSAVILRTNHRHTVADVIGLVEMLSRHASRAMVETVDIEPSRSVHARSQVLAYDAAPSQSFTILFDHVSQLSALKVFKHGFTFHPDEETVMRFADKPSFLRHSQENIEFPSATFNVYSAAYDSFRGWGAIPMSLDFGDVCLLESLMREPRRILAGLYTLRVTGMPREDVKKEQLFAAVLNAFPDVTTITTFTKNTQIGGRVVWNRPLEDGFHPLNGLFIATFLRNMKAKQKRSRWDSERKELVWE